MLILLFDQAQTRRACVRAPTVLIRPRMRTIDYRRADRRTKCNQAKLHLLVASFQAEYAAAAVGNIEKTRKRNNNVGFSGRLVDWAAIL